MSARELSDQFQFHTADTRLIAKNMKGQEDEFACSFIDGCLFPCELWVV